MEWNSMKPLGRKKQRCSPGIALVFILLVCLFGCSIGEHKYENTHAPALEPDSVTLELNGTTWKRVMNWEFSDSWYPKSWGWGDWTIEEGVLTGEDAYGTIAVYFFPFTHSDNTLIETRVRLDRDMEGQKVEGHLLTRDDRAVLSESGIVLIADKDGAEVRHMVEANEMLDNAFPIGKRTVKGEWYTMRFMFQNGVVNAYVDDKHTFSSVTVGKRHASAADSLQGVWPVSVYNEPHVAVRYGAASFEYVRIYINADAHPGQVAGPVAGPASSRFNGGANRHWLVTIILWLFFTVIALVCIYIIRHYIFTLNRLFGCQRKPYLDIDSARWPEVTVLIPAHNEELVIGEILEALLDVDYPKDKLTVCPINDRSKDRTGEIIDSFSEHHPDTIKPFHRTEGTAGKAAALNAALNWIQTEIILVFDADYVPGRGLIKQLVAPFFDPEVGTVMGRVVPYNVKRNLLTRLLDLERSGGYQVDQQARMNLKMVPQYGGTVGGIRRSALLSVGGWREDSLAEDTDATYRLLLQGWKTVYQNRSECYEQVPESWGSRLRQIMRWAKGHNQSTTRYSFALLRNRRTRFSEKLDGLLLLGVYAMSPILVFGWLMGILLWYLGEPRASLILILVVTSYSTLGNFAVFYEIAAAAQLDGSRERIRLLPFVFLGFLVSLFSVSRALFSTIAKNGNGNNGENGEVQWDKTERNGSFNGHFNGYPNGHEARNGRHEGATNSDRKKPGDKDREDN